MYLTLEESTTENISPIMENIIKNISGTKTSDTIQKDYLFVLVTVLMIENGFLPINSDDISDVTKFITLEAFNKWKTPLGSYEAVYVMSDFRTLSVKVIMSPLGATALLNTIISDLNFETYSVCLPISRYVVSPHASTIPMMFRDLKHFSTNIKNKILSPVKSRLLSHSGYASASVIGLPEEVLFKILLYLPIEDVLSVCKTCTRLNFLIENNILWHNMYRRDFHDSNTQTDGKSWKILYKETYTLHLDREQRNNVSSGAGTMHDYMDYSDFVSYIDNPMWDVLI